MMQEIRRTGNKVALRVTAFLLAAGILGMAAAAGWYWMFCMPCRVREDCRGRNVDVEILKQWEKQGQDGSLGIIRMAGWRIGREQTIASVSTKREQRAGVIWVYGSMELADAAKLLRGRFGLASEEGYCVVSTELAENLFGSIDVVGECVKTEDRKMVIAGVADMEGSVFMAPAEGGKMEYLAIEFDSRAGAEGKIERLLREY